MYVNILSYIFIQEHLDSAARRLSGLTKGGYISSIESGIHDSGLTRLVRLSTQNQPGRLPTKCSSELAELRVVNA